MTALVLLSLEMLFVALVIILCYRLREHFGLAMLYVFVGSNQYVQTILASTLYLPIPGGYAISPGSVVIFTSSLFAILLVYLKEDVPQTRTLIYGIVVSNLTLTALSAITHAQIAGSKVINVLGLPPALFEVNPRIFLVGTATLIIDSILVIVIYEYLFFRAKGLPLLMRIITALLSVLYVDAVVFTVGSFWQEPNFRMLLVGNIIGKTFSGIFYGVVLYLYLAHLDHRRYALRLGQPRAIRDVFSILTYRERYEQVISEKAEQEKRHGLQLESAERALVASEVRYRQLFEAAEDGILVLDGETAMIIEANRSLCDMLGYSNEELAGARLTDTVAFRALATDGRALDALRRNEYMRHDALQLERKDGRVLLADLVCIAQVVEGRKLVQCYLRDVSDRRAAEEALRESEERYALVARATTDGLWDWNLKKGVTYFSPRWKSMLGFQAHEIGTGIEEWFGRVHREDLPSVREQLDLHLKGVTDVYESEHRLLHKDKTFRWVSCRGAAVRNREGQPYRVSGTHSDITERKAVESQLLHQAIHDPLTSLPNRILFVNRLERSIAFARRGDDYQFAVLLLDLDRFKLINDSLGHTAGDELLVVIAGRLSTTVAPGDTVARIGGDEFAILIEGISDVSDASRLAHLIQEQLRAPVVVGGHEVFATASTGIVLSSPEYATPEELLRDADTAMYRAKSHGKGRHEIFDTTMHARAVNLLKLETDLRLALKRDELRVHYQPILSLSSKSVVGFEALVRWVHPERGMIAPLDFIPLAEETGLIGPLGEWVLRQACREFVKWEGLRVSVNLSARQFEQENLSETIALILSEEGLAPERLELELTESVVMDDADATLATLNQLNDVGVKLSIDDFGTGYSSLSYLKKFPIDTLKIDRSFVQDITTDPEDRAIATAVITLARSLELTVIAEGVETVEQMTELARLDCEFAQGYYFSKPVPAEEIPRLLRELSAARR